MVGDLFGNVVKVCVVWEQVWQVGVDMLVLFEMFIIGYQMQDLVLKVVFIEDVMVQIEMLVVECVDGFVIGIGGFYVI